MKLSLNNLKVGQRISLVVGLAVLTAIALTGLGLYGLSKTNASLKTVYEDRLITNDQLVKIDSAMLTLEAQSWNIAGETKEVVGADHKKITILNKEVVDSALPVIKSSMTTIDEQWKAYMATYLTPEEKILAAKFDKSKDDLINNAVNKELAPMAKLDAAETMTIADSIEGKYNKANTDLDALMKLQVDVASQEYNAAEARFKTISYISYGALALAFAILMFLGKTLIASIVKPLQKSIEVFKQIENGNYESEINLEGSDELSNVLQSLDGMQKKLGNDLKAKEVLARQVEAQKTLYENELAAIRKSTGVVDMDLDGKITDANDIFLNALGYNKEELLSKDPHDLMNKADLEKGEYKKNWNNVLHGEAFSEQIKRIGKDGKEVWLEATYNPILTIEGSISKVIKVVHYARDITEQKLKDMDFVGQLNAIGKSQGVIELDLEGYIIKVNQTYCEMLGYQEQDLLEKHVSMVLDPTFANSSAYKELWAKLKNGSTDSGQYKRIGKGGKEVWIQASYNPIKNADGKIIKIVNYTIDITDEKLEAANNAGQIAAINKTQGVVEFDLTGKILSTNENFANVTGYSENEIVGNHHSMFVDAAYKSNPEYKAFWDKLGRGEAETGQYKRIAKGGKEIWLQASYNPILDLNGKPFKVVKYATDITAQYNASKSLELAVEETQGIIEGAKAGDLSSRVSLEGKTGAIASLCDGVNALMDKMTEVIAQVREAGETINTAATEIATGNNDLSARTEQQASSLEETASSMEELASTVKQNAENAKQANQLAAAASGVAVKGGEVVGNVVATMADINTSARKIEDIISVIDGIAFQTNILALNAAVEAARAGEQGRGFAVVADEVRNLAQRSASAAKEIKGLITDSVAKTTEGTKLVEDAGNTMQEIVLSVQRVTDIMGEISAASSEQSAGIDQVNTAITSMDEVTQQNAALVEEAAAAAESLVEQAASLMDTVGAFRLAGGNQYNSQSKTSKPAPSYSSNSERRSNNSSMRASTPVAKPASKPAARIIAKTGTDDGEWEEF